ncbi:MAG: hypothetical protein QM315_08300 [Bacillota bacterium]|jgi:uncharacterized protein YeaO (DUF488 family)|nr:hypothetical protein [Bacillota bacterium]
MKKLQLFRRAKQDDESIHTALTSICNKLSFKTGIDRFIIKEDFVILSGSETDYNMILELSQVKMSGKLYLYANLWIKEVSGAGGETSWYEWDFKNFEAFSDTVVDYISPLINRTVKFIVEWKRKENVTFSTAVLDEDNGEWNIVESEMVQYKLVSFFIKRDKIEETVCVFKI